MRMKRHQRCNPRPLVFGRCCLASPQHVGEEGVSDKAQPVTYFWTLHVNACTPMCSISTATSSQRSQTSYWWHHPQLLIIPILQTRKLRPREVTCPKLHSISVAEPRIDAKSLCSQSCALITRPLFCPSNEAVYSLPENNGGFQSSLSTNIVPTEDPGLHYRASLPPVMLEKLQLRPLISFKGASALHLKKLEITSFMVPYRGNILSSEELHSLLPICHDNKNITQLYFQTAGLCFLNCPSVTAFARQRYDIS